MRKTLVPIKLDDYKGPEGLSKLLSRKIVLEQILEKLKDLVTNQKSFEEESMLYNYKGKDKDLIWSCMEFFYQNLWNKNFKEYIWTDPADNWENYNIQLKYKDKYSSVVIVYGIGAFCVIGPDKKVPNENSKILDLDRIKVLTTTEVIYDE